MCYALLTPTFLSIEPGQHGRLVRTTTTKVGTQECLVVRNTLLTRSCLSQPDNVSTFKTFGLEDYPNDQIGSKHPIITVFLLCFTEDTHRSQRDNVSMCV